MHTRTGLIALTFAIVTPAALLLISRAAPDVHILDSTKPAVTSSMTVTTTATATVPALPPRPLDLSFIVDESPCELLPADQLGGLFTVGKPNLGTLPEFNSPRCSFSNGSAGWAVTSITSTGMTGWLAPPTTAATPSTVGTPERIYDPATAKNHDTIHGYPAKMIDNEAAACAVFVDIADNAMLLTEYRIANGAAQRAGAACAGARRVAELALRTLIG